MRTKSLGCAVISRSLKENKSEKGGANRAKWLKDRQSSKVHAGLGLVKMEEVGSVWQKRNKKI